MNCPDCGNPNAATATECEFCGRALTTSESARKTQLDRGQALDPSKRRTLYDPGPPKPAGAAREPSLAAPLDPFNAAPKRSAPDPVDPFKVAAPPPPPAAPVTLHHATVAEGPTDRRAAGVLVARSRASDPGVVYVLRQGRNTLGRDEGQDIRLTDGKVSNQHAFVFVRPDGASFIDVSTNGSLLDGVVLHGQQGELRDGSWFRVGGTVLVFTRLPDAPESAWETT